MVEKNFKLEEAATCEILVADTDSESGAEVSYFDDFEEAEGTTTKTKTKTTTTTKTTTKQ